MHEPIIKKICKMIAIPDTHPQWPLTDDANTGQGGGAVIPLLGDDLSMGVKSDLSEFWINWVTDKEMRGENGPTDLKRK